MYNVHVLPKLNVDLEEKSMIAANIRMIIESMRKVADRMGVQMIVGSEVPTFDWYNDRTTLFLAVGGDGTMLQAMKMAVGDFGVAHGINLGQVGFLTDFQRRGVDREVFEQRLEHLFSEQDQYIEERVILRALDDNYAINEISFSHRESDSMIKYQLFVDGSNAGVHKANSLLVSTSTGSTAYALAAGGAIMMPDLKAMQIIPVAPAKLTSRPIIVSHRSDVEVHVWGSSLSVRFDGQPQQITQPVGNQPLIVKVRADLKSKVVHFQGWDFFEILSTKLGWMRE